MGHWECLESFLRLGNKFFYLKEKTLGCWRDLGIFPNILFSKVVFFFCGGFEVSHFKVFFFFFFFWKSGEKWIFPVN